jgi:predicted PilT family ATPase
VKIPNSVRIGGIEYPIVYVKDLNTGVQLAYGHIDYDNCVIELSDNFGTAHEKRCCVLWHEILHGIREHAGIEIADEETVVDMFAKGIYQVLQDNGQRFFDIVKEMENEQ